MAAGRYVERNPPEAGSVENATDYHWSSARYHCGLTESDYLVRERTLPAMAKELGRNEKSIRRMLGPSGNPTLKNFVRLLKACSKAERFKLEVCSH